MRIRYKGPAAELFIAEPAGGEKRVARGEVVDLEEGLAASLVESRPVEFEREVQSSRKKAGREGDE